LRCQRRSGRSSSVQIDQAAQAATISAAMTA
jgi:hypothetical protein